MDNRRKHSKRVFAMLLALIMCLSQAVTAAADEVSANETVSEESAVPEAASEETEEAAEAVPEETVSEEAAPEEPEEAVSGEAVPVEAEPEEAAGDVGYSVYENLRYVVSGNGEEVIIVGHKDPKETATGSIEIPAAINELPVTVISDNAFDDYRKLINVSLGSNIKTIGDYAFNSCSGFTGTLTLPNQLVTIGDYAFSRCSGFSGSLVIPNTVVTIGDHAFNSCSGFSGSLTIGNSVKTIENYAFNNCYNLTGNLTIPDGVTTIGEGAFWGCNGLNGTLTIPNSVTTIGSIAFDACYNISRITNNSAVSMPVKWFWKNSDNKTICFKDANGNKITNRKTEEFTTGVYQRKFDIPLEAVSLNKANLYLVVNESETLSVNVTPETTIFDEVTWSSSVPEVATVSNGVVTAKKRGKTVITATTVSGGLKASCNVTVGDLCYVVSENGKEVIITGHKDPKETATGSIEIPASINGLPVTVISDYAFKEYDNITSLSLGSSIKTIGEDAFSKCCKLSGNLVIPNGATTIGNGAFFQCYRFTGNLTIPNSVVTIGDSAFGDCDGFTGLTIGNSVKTIGNYAFGNCQNLSGSLTIPDSVTMIDNCAFSNCRNLSGSLTIPDSVTRIGDQAFYLCYSFTGNLTIGNSVTMIEQSAFEDCYGFIGSLTIPGSVKTIRENAFHFCRFTTISNNSSCSVPVNDFWDSDTVCFVNDSGTEFRKGDNISTGRYVRKIETPKSVSLDRTEMTVSVGTRQKLTATISPDNVYDKSITWSSSDERVARVDNEGNVRGIKDGTATITATPKHGSKTAACKVTVKAGVYDDKLLYVLSDNEAEVIITGHKGGSEASGSLVIPASINVEDHNYPVTAISDDAFKGCEKLTGPLKIPDSVTTIGKWAFCSCGFNGDLTIPNSMTIIEEHAFANCQNLSGSLTLPDSVTAIGNAAFDKCYDICRIENKSSQKLPVNWFWDVNDTTTKCFKDANGNKITNRESGEFSKGVYERKIDTPPTGVVLDQTTLEVIIGTPGTLKATVSPSNTYWDEVSWNSSDKTVATVSDGVVTGIKPGNTVVTVTTVSGPFSASCNVTVKRIPVTGVTLNKSAISMYPAETEDLTATVAPSDASNKSVRWFTSNEKVAIVDNGRVTSVSPGSAVITVSTNDGGFTATCTVKVYTKATAHKVTFKNEDGSTYATQTVENGKQATDPGSPSKPGYIFIGWSDGTSIWNFTTPVNKDLTLTAKYKAEQAVVSENTGSGMDPTPVVDEPEKKGEKTAYKLYLVKGQTFAAGGKGWTTSDKTIANVAKNNGKITAKKSGTATVTNETTEYTVYVAAPAVSKNSKSVTILVGQSAEVGIDLQAVDGTAAKYPITWYSANPKVAVVNGGMVTGVAKGSTKVTAYIGGKAYNATVKVIDTCKAPSKITGDKAEFSMNPLQSFNVKFDNSVLTVKKAVWSGDGMAEVKNKSGNVTGYKNKVINITTSGKFTAIGPGTTTVTGKDDSSRTVTVTVTVVPVSTKGLAYITKGKTDTIKFPKVTNKKADWWKSSNEKAATVDTSKKDGKVKGIDYGTSDISCLYKGFTFNTPVYVEDPVMVFGGKEVKNKEKLEMKVGEMKQLKINKTFQTLNFKSSKQANAFVDENGFVYARKKGKANISTKINGTTYQIAITVIE